jgi:predicted O-linked N-acetylglucosamine transferase (SPINDLY family)
MVQGVMSGSEALLLDGHRALGEGRLDAAEAALIAARAALPDHPDVLHLLGVVALKRGDAAGAVELIAAAVLSAERIGQRRGEFHINLGNALAALGRPAAALEAYREAVKRAPMVPEAHNNLAVALDESGDTDGAARSYHSALALRRDYAEARYNLANLRRGQRRFEDARAGYRQALALAPGYGSAWLNLASLLHDLGEVAAAEAPMRRAHAIEPGRPGILANLINLVRLLDETTGADVLALGRRFDALYAQPLATRLPPLDPKDRRGSGRLRLGYVGADSFRLHTASVSILPLLEAHDRRQFEIVCYSDLPEPAEDEITQRFRAASSFQVTHGLSDEALARRMREDRIDIAIDVLGYPTGSRLLALAHRPAPVQVNLLLMGSFGLDAVGWAIGDARLTPPTMERDFSERIERIDLAFMYDPLSTTPEVSALPALRADHVTFGSLNQPAKLSPRCLEAWANILGHVPDSRLVLKAKAFQDAVVAERLLGFFDSRNIHPDRIDLRGWTPTQEGHLAIFREIDIALDTFPYGGVISTCEALWMGVPVVSLMGDRVLGRYGGVFLETVGLPDLVAGDVDAYVETAARLADDIARLAGIRATLRQRMAASRLCDGPAYARAIEGAYRRIWQSRPA